MRVGIGYDSHRFTPGRPLILGGVAIDHPQGLAGHSDADTVAHAITDAMLGAAALGDIGSHFPPSDAQWQNANSIDLLGRVNLLLQEQGYEVVNVDVTIVCEEPKIGPYASAMRAKLAAVLGIGAKHVSVKGKTNEGMGWIGRGEGIAALAVVLIATVEG